MNEPADGDDRVSAGGRNDGVAATPPEPLDPLAKFLRQHAVSPRQAVEDDVAEWRGVPPERSFQDGLALARSAARVLAWGGCDPLEVALERDPPHPSLGPALERLRRNYTYRETKPS